LHPCSNDQERETAMARPVDQDQLLARLEAAALELRRGSVVIYEVCVSDATGTHLRPAEPVLVPEGSSRVVAGIPFALRSLRHRPRHLPRALPWGLRAAVHDLRAGRSLGSAVMLTRRPGSSWAA
jgi:hypothetical protein